MVCPNVSERYEKVGRIGEGTYGIVYKARDRKTHQFVALKRCLPHHQASDGFPITTLREIHALRVCARHPYIVTLQHVAVSKNGVFLVMEYCEHDLANLLDKHYRIHQKSPFQIAQCKRLAWQLLQAVQFLHQNHLLHRDLKVSNLLYHHGCLKVADLGLSRSWGGKDRLTQQVASLWYRPVELLNTSLTVHYTSALDCWAVGCIIAEMIQGQPLMPGKSELDQLTLIQKWLGNERYIWDAFSHCQSGLPLLLGLLELDPEQRWTTQRALQSDWFQEAPLPTPEKDMPYFSTKKEQSA